MKTHARNIAIGGILVPLALGLATLIANEAQTLIGLHLDNVALSLYLLPFLAAAGAALAALLHLEATKVGGELGGALKDLGDLAASVFGGSPETGPVGADHAAAPGTLQGAPGLIGDVRLPPAPPPPPPPAP